MTLNVELMFVAMTIFVGVGPDCFRCNLMLIAAAAAVAPQQKPLKIIHEKRLMLVIIEWVKYESHGFAVEYRMAFGFRRITFTRTFCCMRQRDDEHTVICAWENAINGEDGEDGSQYIATGAVQLLLRGNVCLSGELRVHAISSKIQLYARILKTGHTLF